MESLPNEDDAKIAIDKQCHDFLKIKSDALLYLTIQYILALICSIIDITFKNFNYILMTVILYLVLYVIYKSYLSPVYYYKELTDVGFDHIPPGPHRIKHINRAQSAREVGSKLPPPYPNGWFALVESRDLRVGGVVPVDALGCNFCVYRGEDGVARVVDAYCPHLGAHLAVGGAVRGDCIQCPFHQWTFGADGGCVGVPGVENVPKGISIKTWPAAEVDGAVWVWHDAERRPPLWAVPAAPELRTWGYRGRNEFIVSAHIQEIPENGADVAHLNAVHSASFLSDIGNRYPILNNFIGYHVWSAEWSKCSEEHKATMNIVQKYIIMKCNVFPINVTVHQIGPAHVRLRFSTALGPLLLVQSVTPLAPLLQRVTHRVYSPAYNAAFGLYTVFGEANQFRRDVAIWNSKRYAAAPAYARRDRAVRAFRAWFAQFYSERSAPPRRAPALDW